jgi:CheY-like chemotaxis protein
MKKPGARVLVVDDDPGVIWTVGRTLTRAGLTVTTCQDGADALSLLESKEFDLMITDIQLRELNGLALLEWARANRPALKVIVITGYGSSAVKNLALSKGAYVYMEKPVDLDLLIAMISESDDKKSFSGNIDEIDILDYVQLMTLSGRQVVLEVISREGRRGLLYIDKGEVCHAVCGDLEGEEAVYSCLRFSGGSFVNLPWKKPERTTVNKPAEFLLMEAARQRDEMAIGDAGTQE